MLRYAELRRTADGRWRVFTIVHTHLPLVDVPGAVRFELVDAADPDPPLYRWLDADGVYQDDGWTPPAVVQPAVSGPMSRLAFISRYTLEEQVAIELAANGTGQGLTGQQRATLRVIERMLQAATDVRLDDPRTQQAVGLHAQMGLITPQRAQQILDPNWSPA